MAFAKAQVAADGGLPLEGGVLVTVNDSDKPTVLPIVRRFHEMGFRVTATEGTRKYLRARGVPAEMVRKAYEGRPNAIDLIVSGDVHLLINTPLGKFTQADDYAIRRAAVVHRVPYTTTMSAASAACDAIIAYRSNPHLDQAERGREAARLIARTLAGEVRPTMAAARPPLVINIDPAYHTVPLGLVVFQGQWTSNIPLIAAGATITFLPLVAMFLVFQRQLIEGLTQGAVKG